MEEATAIAQLVSAIGVNGVLGICLWKVWKRYVDLQDRINTVLFKKIANGKKPKEPPSA